ncbi:MAG: hypothetical protein ABH821_02050 [archaeon]
MAKQNKAKKPSKKVKEIKKKTVKSVAVKPVPVSTPENLDIISSPVQEPETKEKQGMPLYLIGLIVLLVVVIIASAGFFVYFNQEPIDEPIIPPEEGTLRVIAVIDESCVFCDNVRSNSFLAVLTSNKINYELTSVVDVFSENGQALVESFGLDRVPVVLVDAASIDSNFSLRTVDGQEIPLGGYLKEEFELIQGVYVVPELSLLPGMIHTETFLGKPTGACLSNETVVEVFNDPFCSACMASKQLLNEIKANFEPQGIKFIYRNFPTVSLDYYDQGFGLVQLNGKAFVCAEKQGVIDEMEDCFYDYYCDSTGNKDATVEEIQSCVLSPHYGTVLSSDEVYGCVDRILGEVGFEGEEFDAEKQEFIDCFNTNQTVWFDDIVRAENHYISSTPIAMINCKYLTHAAKSGDILCHLNPDLNGCVSAQQ